jgi:hypothetical protein
VPDHTEFRVVGDVLLRPIDRGRDGKPVRVLCWAWTKDGYRCLNWAKWLTAGYVPVCGRHTAADQPYQCPRCNGTGVCVEEPGRDSGRSVRL